MQNQTNTLATEAEPSPSHHHSPWPAVISIAIGAFALVTTEFLPVGLLPAIAAELGVTEGDKVKVTQGSGSAILVATVDAKLPANAVRVAAAHASTAALGSMFGSITVEKAGEGK